jgi:hypothetical protein
MAAKKTASKKATAKKTASRNGTGNRASSKKATAKKATAKKTTAKKTTAKKATAKKATAKKREPAQQSCFGHRSVCMSGMIDALVAEGTTLKKARTHLSKATGKDADACERKFLVHVRHLEHDLGITVKFDEKSGVFKATSKKVTSKKATSKKTASTEA